MLFTDLVRFARIAVVTIVLLPLPALLLHAQAPSRPHVASVMVRIDANNRMAVGRTFTLHLTDTCFKNHIRCVSLRPNAPTPGRDTVCGDAKELELVAHIERGAASNMADIVVNVPEWRGALETYLGATFFLHPTSSYDAWLVVRSDSNRVEAFPVELADTRWALIWGVLAVVASLVGTFGLYRIGRWWRGRSRRRKGAAPASPGSTVTPGSQSLPRELGSFVMNFTLSPTHYYSLSRFQTLLWTCIVIFGVTYIWKVSQVFLDITPQILLLVGISGGTLAASRVQLSGKRQSLRAALDGVPEPYRRVITESRKPRLSDLFMEGTSPSVTKFQMLVFTIIIAGTVVKEICYEYAFPALSDGLVALMGISSAVYLGNNAGSGASIDAIKAKVDEVKGRMDVIHPELMAKAGVAELRAEHVHAAMSTEPSVQELRELIDAYLG